MASWPGFLVLGSFTFATCLGLTFIRVISVPVWTSYELRFKGIVEDLSEQNSSSQQTLFRE